MLEVNIKKKLPGFSLDAAFSIEREILAILGPSGCGKSLTIQCIAGLVRPDQGRIVLNGKVLYDGQLGINLPPQSRKVGLVFQNYALFPHLTVGQNVAFGIQHLSKAEIKDKVTILLQKMKLQGLEGRYPHQLSGGQQQRVALARALAPEPELLLLDEPFSALDTQVKEQLLYELYELHNYYRGSILFVTHNVAEAYSLCSKMAVYGGGKLLQFGDKQDVVEGPATLEAAKLLGVENFLQGVVTCQEGNEVCVQVKGLDSEVKALIPDNKKITMNQPVILGIRSEFLRITASSSVNTFSATVSQVVEEVTNYTYYFNFPDVQDLHLVARIPKQEGALLDPGSTVYLNLPQDKLFIIT